MLNKIGAKEILGIRDMAAILGRSERAIRIAICRGGKDLPPSQLIAAKRAWIRTDVEIWLKSLSFLDSEGE